MNGIFARWLMAVLVLGLYGIEPCHAQSDTARFLACFSVQKGDSLPDANVANPIIPDGLAEKFVLKPLKSWVSLNKSKATENHFFMLCWFSGFLGQSSNSIHAGSKMTIPTGGYLLYIGTQWGAYNESYSLLLHFGSDMGLKGMLLVNTHTGDAGSGCQISGAFDAGYHSVVVTQKLSLSLSPIYSGEVSELIRISPHIIQQDQKAWPPEASWALQKDTARRFHLGCPPLGFCLDESWASSFSLALQDPKTKEMLLLEDYGENGIGAGYKAKPSAKDWLKLEVLNYSREAHQLTVRFPGDKITYTLRLNPSHTACESQGSDGSAVQVFKAIQDK